jgi:RNA polymerase sigma-70 factor (ECF subfamily)
MEVAEDPATTDSLVRTEPPVSGSAPSDGAAQKGKHAIATDADKSRLAALVQSNYDFLWRTVRRLGLAPAAADDAVQQVFLVASRRLPEIAVGAERTFLYRTAVYTARKARHVHGRSVRRSADYDVTHAADPTPTAEELTDHKRARAVLEELLHALDEPLRDVFVLFELDGLSIPEIAEILGLPAGTCSSRLRRAREAFKGGIARIRAKQAFDAGRGR